MLERIWKKILRRKGISCWSIPAVALWLASIAYRLCYRVGRALSRTKVAVPLPVVCVGNITVGGTGKTPMVAFLARYLLDESIRVGIVSSGYGRSRRQIHDGGYFIEPGYRVQKMKAADVGDEVLLLANLLPEAIFSVGEFKALAASKLADSKEVDLIIVDDGFQHVALKRDLDVVTFDAAVKEKHLRWFPHGVLREPMTALRRANVVVITRSNFARDLGLLKKKLKALSPQAEHYSAQFLESELVGKEERRPLKYLEDKSVFLFAGVGNFGPLEKQVAALSADLDYALELSDHQKYDKPLLARIKSLADKYDSDVILTTGKDWVKLQDFAFGRETYYLVQSIDLDPGEEKLVDHIKEKLGLTGC